MKGQEEKSETKPGSPLKSIEVEQKDAPSIHVVGVEAIDFKSEPKKEVAPNKDSKKPVIEVPDRPLTPNRQSAERNLSFSVSENPKIFFSAASKRSRQSSATSQ